MTATKRDFISVSPAAFSISSSLWPSIATSSISNGMYLSASNLRAPLSSSSSIVGRFRYRTITVRPETADATRFERIPASASTRLMTLGRSSRSWILPMPKPVTFTPSPKWVNSTAFTSLVPMSRPTRAFLRLNICVLPSPLRGSIRYPAPGARFGDSRIDSFRSRCRYGATPRVDSLSIWYFNLGVRDQGRLGRNYRAGTPPREEGPCKYRYRESRPSNRAGTVLVGYGELPMMIGLKINNFSSSIPS